MYSNLNNASNLHFLFKSYRMMPFNYVFSRDQGSRRDSNEDEKIQRLFVIVPKNMTDAELQDHFKQFGDIEYANIIKDKETRESKGFAYIKYYR